ncbi:helix-turn-helix domain-containing protein [Sphingomonas mesophila]|uniref:helix-turn-helix domain-containing protein n=1 Tax=Sphingomonas mesophila TaxID=2303576 RepID=UPI000E57AF42
MQRILISVQETGELLGVKKTSTYKLLNLGLIQSTTIGRRRLIFLDSVHSYLSSRPRMGAV